MTWNRAWRWSGIGIFGAGLIVGFSLSGSAVSGLQREAPPTSDQAILHVLAAKDAIRDQIYNYSRGLDRMDRELALQVFHDDAVVTQPGPDGGGFKGDGAAWIATAWRGHEAIAAHSHQMTNTLINVNDDKASSETYAMASLRAEPSADESSTTTYVVRYVDTWSKRNGRWAIDTRTIVVDFTLPHHASGPNRGSAGKRNPSDPSYVVF